MKTMKPEVAEVGLQVVKIAKVAEITKVAEAEVMGIGEVIWMSCAVMI